MSAKRLSVRTLRFFSYSTRKGANGRSSTTPPASPPASSPPTSPAAATDSPTPAPAAPAVVNGASDAYRFCLDNNSRWAADTAKITPEFFPTSAKGQTPKILWLGCSDSRVPETTLLGLKPGEVFSHRNIANIVQQSDLSMLSVVEFAVRHLKVKHVVVCGHTACGGVAACLDNATLGVLDIWLQPMRKLREEHTDELAKLEGAEKGTYLCKQNVKQGLEVLKRIPTVIEAVKERGLQLHGALYHLDTGKLENIDIVPEDEVLASKRSEAFLVK